MAREIPGAGPHFRAADLETADRKAALEAKGVTTRALVVGGVFVMLLAWLTPYVEEYLNGTLIASNHLPVSALLVLLAVGLVLNVGLSLHRLPGWVRAAFLGGYSAAYWSCWVWYQYEGARLFVGEGQGEPLTASGWWLAVLGFGAGLAFFGAGAFEGRRPRRVLGAASGVMLFLMALVIVMGGEGAGAQLRRVEILALVATLLAAGAGAYMMAAGGPFDRGESLVVLAMTMVMAAIPNIGLMGYLIPVMTAPYYYASPENGWAERLHQHIKPWLSPRDDPEAGYMPVSWLYDGLPKDQAIPWGAWVKPLFFWTVFTLFIYGIMFFLAAILRRQWSDKERLPFPLAQVPLAMTEGYRPGDVIAPFFRDKLVWIGAAIPFVIHSYNSLHDFFPSVPQIPLHFRNIDRDYLTEPPWTAFRPLWILIYPSVIGLTYLISLEAAFSLWFFYFVQKMMVFTAVQMGYGTSGWDFGGDGWRSMTVNQGFGAMLAMVGLGAYMARGHLKDVARKALSPLVPADDVDDSVEPVGYRLAFWGFWACVAGAVAWLWAAGMSLWVALVLFALFIVTIVGLSRLVAEGGLFYVQSASTAPQTMLEASVGTAPLGARNLTVGGFLHGIYMFDLRSMVMPSIIHSFKIAGEGGVKRRHMALSVALALVLGLFFSYVSFLYLSYKVGGVRMERWFFVQWPSMPFRNANNRIKKDMGELTKSCRTVISETRALLAEKPWAVDERRSGKIEAALSDLEAVLEDVETSNELRSRLSSLKEGLRSLYVALGHEALRKALSAVADPGRRTVRAAYALVMAAEHLKSLDFPAGELRSRLEAVSGAVAEWRAVSCVSPEGLYKLKTAFDALSLTLSRMAETPLSDDGSPLAGEIRSLARSIGDLIEKGGPGALRSPELDRLVQSLSPKVDALFGRWGLVRGVEMLRGPVSQALGMHESAVSARELRDKALEALAAAAPLYRNSAFVSGTPVLAASRGGPRLLVYSGDGTLFGLEPDTGDPVFKRNLDGVAAADPIVVDLDRDGTDEVFLAARRGHVYLLGARRGHILWSRSLQEGITVAAGPVEWNGRLCVLVGTESGRVVVTALRGGRRLAEYEVSGGVAVSSLAAFGGRLFAGYPGGAVVLEMGKDGVAGRLDFGRVKGLGAEEVPAGFAPSGDGTLVITRSGAVVDWRGGRGRVSEELGKAVLRVVPLDGKAAVVVSDGIAVLSGDGRLERFDRLGKVAAAAGSGGKILAALSDGTALEWSPDGSVRPLAKKAVEAASAPVPVRLDGFSAVVMADASGAVYAVSPDGADEWRFGTPRRREPEVYWYSPDWARLGWTGVGAAVYTVFALLRQRVMWWPHPIGYVFMMSKAAYQKLWFSFLLGWLCKFVILRYLGFKTYYRMRGFFIGLVLGEVMAAGLWIFVDFVMDVQHGWPIHIN